MAAVRGCLEFSLSGTVVAISPCVTTRGASSTELEHRKWSDGVSELHTGTAVRGGIVPWWTRPSSHCAAGLFLSFGAGRERSSNYNSLDRTELGKDVVLGFDDDNRVSDWMLSALPGGTPGRPIRGQTVTEGKATAGRGYLRPVGTVGGTGSLHSSAPDTLQGVRFVCRRVQVAFPSVSAGGVNREKYPLLHVGYPCGTLWRMGKTVSARQSRDGWSGNPGTAGDGDRKLFYLANGQEAGTAGSGMKDSWRTLARATALLALVATLGCGAVKEKRVVTAPPAYAAARTATTGDLISLINDQYANVESLTVRRCDVEFTGGSIDDGYLEKYRKANGLMIAQDPGAIFVNILNPLTNSTVVVMASRNEQFQIWIPSKNTFVTGRTNVTPEEDNPIYNVRPSHILEGVLVEPIPVDDPNSRYFVIEDQDDQFKYYLKRFRLHLSIEFYVLRFHPERYRISVSWAFDLNLSTHQSALNLDGGVIIYRAYHLSTIEILLSLQSKRTAFYPELSR